MTDSALIHNAQQTTQTRYQYDSLSTEQLGLLSLLRPWIAKSVSTLEVQCAAVEQHGDKCAFETQSAISLFLPSLFRRLHQIVDRTLVLELNVARLGGVLSGEDGNARFDDFVCRLSDPDYARSILDEYPVLLQCAIDTIDQWSGFTRETLTRLQRDSNELARRFVSSEHRLGLLTRLSGDLGDCHFEGRTVVVMTFSCGTQLVYKPRPLQLDVAYNEVVQWFNHQPGQSPMRSVNVLDKGQYGWCEFIAAEALSDIKQAHAYYYRFGRLICIMDLLGGTDIHFENLISCGSHPVVIDLEALLLPQMCEAQAQTLLSSGLLPKKLWFSADEQGVDFGALTAEPGSEVAMPAWGMVKHNSDQMQWSRCKTYLSHSHNIPVFDGKAIPFDDYVEDILLGFDDCIGYVQELRPILLAPNGPLAELARHKTRYVARGTQYYSQLLDASYHPDLLRQEGKRRAFVLANLRESDSDRRASDQMLSREAESICRGNIPAFHSDPRQNALYEGDTPIVEDFFALAGFQCQRQRLDSLNDAKISHLRWFLTAVLTQSMPEKANRLLSGTMPRWSAKPQGRCGEPAVEQWLLDGAIAIGRYLCMSAVCNKHNAKWLGYQPTPSYWVLDECKDDLYGGRLGPVLFLAHLGALTGESEFDAVARLGWQGVLDNILGKKPFDIAGFSGWGGLLYTTGCLARLWPDEDFSAVVDTALAEIRPLIAADERFDIVSGSAGCLLALLHLAEQPAFRQRALEVATLCAEHIVGSVIDDGQACYWPILDGKQPLLGFSHGNAGIALALYQYARQCSAPGYGEVAEKAVRFEDSFYSDTEHNWPDLRTPDGSEFMSTWCYGGAGISLSRAVMAEGDPSQIERCIPQLLNPWAFNNHGLCHGHMGNLDILHSTASIIGSAQLHDAFEQKLALIAEDVAKHGWRSAMPSALPQPGMMDGMAGIGMTLLKFARPSEVPCVLMMSGAVA